jgi:ribosomal protein L21
MMGVDAIKIERLKAKKRRGVNFRYVTEVTKDNLSYCKELSEFAEVPSIIIEQRTTKKVKWGWQKKDYKKLSSSNA